MVGSAVVPAVGFIVVRVGASVGFPVVGAVGFGVVGAGVGFGVVGAGVGFGVVGGMGTVSSPNGSRRLPFDDLLPVAVSECNAGSNDNSVNTVQDIFNGSMLVFRMIDVVFDKDRSF